MVARGGCARSNVALVAHSQKALRRRLRHGLGVATLQASVPLNLVQRWMGHARLSSTAIYTSVCGDDETTFAARFRDGL